MMKNIKRNSVIIIMVAYFAALIIILLVAGKHSQYNGADPEYNRLSGFKTVAATDTAIR